VKGAELYEVYLRWCMEEGVKAFDRNAFYSFVASKYAKYEREKIVWFRG
jgi:phage/plasmid-associated DNA primase